MFWTSYFYYKNYLFKDWRYARYKYIEFKQMENSRVKEKWLCDSEFRIEFLSPEVISQISSK